MENKVLFVNACDREESRTLRLCQGLLDGVAFEEVRVHELGCSPLRQTDTETRDRLLCAGERERFSLARQFARAELIVVGAPYWDLSFPAALKVYVEHVCANGVTFAYGEQGPYGLCRARALCYLTTSGGFLAGANFGGDYFRGLAKFFGIPQFYEVSAEGLDIAGAPVEEILSRACEKVERLREQLKRDGGN